MKPEWFVKINVSKFRYRGKRRQLEISSCIAHASVLGKIYFFCFLFLASLFLGNLRHEAQVFIHTRLLRVNTIMWKSAKSVSVMLLKLWLAKMLAYFYFIFSHSNLFLVQF